MNPIHEKRLKRRLKLEGRVKCHGNNSPCMIIHPYTLKAKEKVVYREAPEAPKVVEKKGWLKRLFNFGK